MYMQEEVVKVEGELQRVAMNRLQEEGRKAEVRLADAVDQVEKKCRAEQVVEVEKARKEEQIIAEHRAQDVAE